MSAASRAGFGLCVRMNAGRIDSLMPKGMHADECGTQCQLHFLMSAR